MTTDLHSNGNGLALRAVDAAVSPDGLTQVNPSPSETIRLGQAAMARQRRAWDDWIAIGEALDVGRSEVMRGQHTNQPTNRHPLRAGDGGMARCERFQGN